MNLRQGLPLVRLSLTLPIVPELDRRRLDTDSVLESSGLVRDTVSDTNVFVPPIVIHRFLEDAAEAARDPYRARAWTRISMMPAGRRSSMRLPGRELSGSFS